MLVNVCKPIFTHVQFLSLSFQDDDVEALLEKLNLMLLKQMLILRRKIQILIVHMQQLHQKTIFVFYRLPQQWIELLI